MKLFGSGKIQSRYSNKALRNIGRLFPLLYGETLGPYFVILKSKESFGSNRLGGMNVAFVDGATHFISDTVEHNQLSWAAFLTHPGDLGVFQRLLGTNDGQVNGEVF